MNNNYKVEIHSALNICISFKDISTFLGLFYASRLGNQNIVGLVGFYGILTIVGYLMPNPFYTYILNI